MMDSYGAYEFIDKVVQEYADTIFKVAFHRLNNFSDAQDVTQDVIIKRMTYNGEFENKEHEKAWIIRVTLNLCNDLFRTVWKKRVVSLNECIDAPSIPKDSVLSSVMELSEKYRTVVYLYYYEGYTVKEIAGLLKLSEAFIQSRLYRARNLLKIEMEADERV